MPLALIRPLQPSDLAEVVAVYRDAVISQTQGLYTAEQIRAWADHAQSDEQFEQTVLRGCGVASCAHEDCRRIEAFAVLDPADRLALLYCRGRSSRQGRASSLLRVLEERALSCGMSRLRTEASQLSRPLLERHGWRVEAEERLLFAGVIFDRWLMIKDLR